MNKPFENTFDVKYDENGIETFNRWQDPTINDLQQQLDKYKNVIEFYWIDKKIFSKGEKNENKQRAI